MSSELLRVPDDGKGAYVPVPYHHRRPGRHRLDGPLGGGLDARRMPNPDIG